MKECTARIWKGYCRGLGMVFPNLVFSPNHSKPCTAYSLPSALTSTGGWRGELEAQKVRLGAIKEEFTGNSNEVKNGQ